MGFHHKQIFLDNSNNSQCYLCWEPIDYYLKFDCSCHNYLHYECVGNMQIKKCVVCKKKINLFQITNPNPNSNTNNLLFNKIFYEITLLDIILRKIKIKIILDIIFDILKTHCNLFTLGIFILINFTFIFGLVIPIYILNIFVNLIKIIYKKKLIL